MSKEYDPDVLHPIKNPFPLWQMISDVEHNLYVALSTGDVADIMLWAELLRDICEGILKELKKYG